MSLSLKRCAKYGVFSFAAAWVLQGHASESTYYVELETGPVWQTSNEVQIPNDETGTRFSLKDITGSGPWAGLRLDARWNVNDKHSLGILLAPLSFSETGSIDEDIRFAGASYSAEAPVEASYTFNSWRLAYRYKFSESERWTWWVGGTAKIRDAEIKLKQGDTESKDDNVGFVPLLHLSGEYRAAACWSFKGEMEALGGGPGRAIDLSLKAYCQINDQWRLGFGYRTLEGGADVDDVYNFAWFNSAVVSIGYRF